MSDEFERAYLSTMAADLKRVVEVFPEEILEAVLASGLFEAITKEAVAREREMWKLAVCEGSGVDWSVEDDSHPETVEQVTIDAILYRVDRQINRAEK